MDDSPRDHSFMKQFAVFYDDYAGCLRAQSDAKYKGTDTNIFLVHHRRNNSSQRRQDMCFKRLSIDTNLTSNAAQVP